MSAHVNGTKIISVQLCDVPRSARLISARDQWQSMWWTIKPFKSRKKKRNEKKRRGRGGGGDKMQSQQEVISFSWNQRRYSPSQQSRTGVWCKVRFGDCYLKTQGKVEFGHLLKPQPKTSEQSAVTLKEVLLRRLQRCQPHNWPLFVKKSH